MRFPGQRRMVTAMQLLGALVLAMVVHGQSAGQPVAGSSVTASEQAWIWVPTGDLNEPRAYHTATLLRDGRVLAVGGNDEGYGAATAELFDPATGKWSRTSSMNVAKSGHSATLLADGRVLVVGWAAPAASSAEVYDPSSGAWTVVSAGTGVWRDQAAALLRSGKVLLAGGWAHPYDSDSASALFDPATGSWSPTRGGLTQGREMGHPATVLQDGRVLITGGTNDADFAFGLPNTDLYDPVQNGWKSGPDMHVPRLGHSATLLPDGKILVAGGDSMTEAAFWSGPWVTGVPRSSWTLNNTAEVFDPVLGTWDLVGSLGVGHSGHTASLLGSGQVLVAGGYTATPPNSYRVTKQAELYDTQSGIWRNADALNRARAGHSATRLPDGRVLVVGGVGGSGAGTSAEIYGPAPPGSISPAYTGSWFDPAQPGHGLHVEVLPNQQFLAAWFAFNPAGTAQAWIIGTGAYSGNTATVDVVQPTGGRWIPNFDPSRIVDTAWGRLTLTFIDCNHGRVDFDSTVPGYGRGSMNLTRLTQPAGLACP